MIIDSFSATFDYAMKENKELESLITTNYVEILDPIKTLSLFERVRILRNFILSSWAVVKVAALRLYFD